MSTVFALGTGWWRSGGTLLLLSHSLQMAAHRWVLGDNQGVLMVSSANTQLYVPGLKGLPWFICRKAEVLKDKMAEQGTPAQDH